MFLGPYEMIYITAIYVFSWESSWCISQGKSLWFYLSYVFLKFIEIHYYELQHHCSPINSVHYVKKDLSDAKKNLDSSGRVYYVIIFKRK